MPTTLNMNKQCVEAFTVADDVLQWILNVPEMPGGTRNYQALTQSEVLHFVDWWPFRTRKEFDQYRANHPSLESLPPTNMASRRLSTPPGQSHPTEEVCYEAHRFT